MDLISVYLGTHVVVSCETNTTGEMHFSLETSVDVSEASSAQIITLHEQQDILPVLLANCTYSLKAGEGTTIRYDFCALEKQIEERFIRGKSRLQPYQVSRSFTIAFVLMLVGTTSVFYLHHDFNLM